MAEMGILLERRTRFGSFLNARLELPASRMEIADALQRVKSEEADDYDITFSSSSVVFELPEDCFLDELNYLAARLSRMDDYEIGYMQAFIQFEESPPDMQRLINMTFNPAYLEAVYAGNWATVGQNYIDGEYTDLTGLPDEIYNLLDAEKVGRYIAEKEGGKLCKNGWYVFPSGKAFEEVYDGVILPPVMNLLDEDEYVFKLLLAPPPESDPAEVEDLAVWITLPGDEEEIDRIAKQMQQAGIEDCVYLEMKTAIPQIDKDVFGDMADFDVLHDIARQYAALDTDEQIHCKAALKLSDPRTLSGVKTVLDHLSEYGWQRDWDSLRDIGRQHATKDMGLTEQQASRINADAIGHAVMMGHYNYKITDYGTVWLDQSPPLLEKPVARQEESAGLYYSQTKGGYVSRENLAWEDMEATGNVHIGSDFYCPQTDGFPTYLYYDTAIGVAWLALSEGTADSYHMDGQSDTVDRCHQLCKAWGVHICNSMEEYEHLLYELEARMCDEAETEDFGMGGMT